MPEESVESRYFHVWRERSRIQPKITDDWVNNEWAKGRSQYLAFLIRIRNQKLIGKIVDIQDKLSTIPCVDPFPKDYLHITVKGCGFPAESEEFEDDIRLENLQRIIVQAKHVLQGFHKFDVCLPRLNIFAEVVLVEVHDEGKIGELNRRLQTIPEIKKMKFDYPILLPHISLAQFQSNQEFTRLITYVEELRETGFEKLTVNRIELVNAHLSKRHPTLKTVHVFKLKQQPSSVYRNCQ